VAGHRLPRASAGLAIERASQGRCKEIRLKTPIGHCAVLFLALLSSLGGCASLPEGKSLDPQDPYERFNRASFAFNDTVDSAILKPASKAYKAIAPEFVRTGIANFFANLSDIPTALNDVLQAKPKGAGVHAARVAVNSTWGLLGFVDVATGMGLERRREDFGLTLGAWGLGSGPYLVLPLLGPSSARDGLGLFADWAAEPIVLVPGEPAASNVLIGTRAVDNRSSLLSAEKALDEIAFDKYSFVREVYLARRRSLVGEHAAPAPASPAEP
jgi:phospholipid-binding lipoprotein MlaA